MDPGAYLRASDDVVTEFRGNNCAKYLITGVLVGIKDLSKALIFVIVDGKRQRRSLRLVGLLGYIELANEIFFVVYSRSIEYWPGGNGFCSHQETNQWLETKN